MDKKLTDNEIIKALERLKNTKDYLKEQYQEQVNKCPYPELKPVAKQTYEDNKKAFDTAIKVIEEFNRLQAEVGRLQSILMSFTSEIEIWSNKKGYDTTELSLIAILDESKNIKANIKAEAYKECIEKVKTLFPSCNEPYQYWEIHEGADNLLKETVGDTDA